MSTVHWRETPGPPAQFLCPKCGRAGIGSSHERHEELLAFHLLPVFWKTTTFVRCVNCKAKLQSTLGIADLTERQGTDISEYVSYEPSFVVKFFAIASFVLFWMPFVGLVLALIAFATTFGKRGWVRGLSIISLTFSSLITVALIVMRVLNGRLP
jgi:hypothetical protein